MSRIQFPGCSKLAINWKKWQWRQNLPTWHHCKNFWRQFVSLVKFRYWFKFHVNIIIGSAVMTIFFYKGLTRILEIGNTPVWVLPNLWRLRQVRDTKFSMNVSNEMPGLYCLWFIKACVLYFHQVFIFSPNESPSKTMKNAIYFI